MIDRIFQGVAITLLLALGGWVMNIHADIAVLKTRMDGNADALERQVNLLAEQTKDRYTGTRAQNDLSNFRTDIKDLEKRLRKLETGRVHQQPGGSP